MYYARITPVYVGETGSHALEVYEADGTQPDLSGHASLSIKIVDYAGSVVQTITNGSVGQADEANGNLTWTPDTATVSQERGLRLFLYGSGNVIAEVPFPVLYSPGV